MTPMEENQLRRVFFPHVDEKQSEVQNDKLRFVYYTNAETAYRLIANKEIWMRSTSTMNDYSEVEHGFECLNAAYNSEAGNAFTSAINNHFPGLANEVVDHFNRWLPVIRNQTYIACLSEHPEDEDQNGRLSMWRAYGGRAGVAIVINAAPLFVQADGVGVYSSPVAYRTQSQVEEDLRVVTQRVLDGARYIEELGRDATRDILFNMFRFSVLCTKHPGFREEREWRVIASPIMNSSPLLTESVEVISGVPQRIQKLKFDNYPSLGVNLDIPHLLNRVVIGPCEHPLAVLFALREALGKSGVQNPEEVVYVSELPLRISA